MAENDSGRLNFSMGIDLSEMRKDAESAKNLLAQIGGAAVSQGEILDRALGEAGAAGTFSVLEAAIHGAGTEIGGLDFGSAQEKIGALSYIIQQNESVTADAVKTLESYRAQADDAFARGDDAALQSLTSDIQDQIAKINQLNEETAGYKATLEAVMSVSGAGASGGNVIRLYDSEADIEQVEALKARITDLSAEIARVGADGGDTSALRADLSSTRDELNSIQVAAAEAAAELGDDLGGRAASAQQTLHQLNTAVSDQQDKIDTLAGLLAEASDEYDRVKSSSESTSDEVERAASAYDELSKRLADARSEMASLQSAQQSAQGAWTDVTNEIQTHDSVMVKMLGGYDNYKTIVGQLPGPLQSVIGGIQGMTGAAKSFLATPLGATIAAITLALQALNTWFHSSTEGQKAFAEISGYVSGVLGQLKEIVITVGNAIYKAFTDPKQALQDFVDALKTNVTNRFQAIGKMAGSVGKIIQSAFKFDWDGVKEGFGDLTDGVLQFNTGVTDVSQKIKAWAGDVKSAADESAAIKSESRELEIEVQKWQVRKQELDRIKAEATAKMYDTSLSAADRQKALADYKAALQEQLDTEQQFADKRVELQQRSMALTTNSDEDYAKLYDLQAAAKAVETSGAQELAALQRRTNSINSALNSDASSIAKAEDARAAAYQKSGETIAALIESNNQMELSLMEEGGDKQIAALQARRKKQIAELEATEAQFKQLNEQSGTETGDDGLTDIQRTQIVRGRTNIESTYRAGINDILQDELSDIMTYEQKRQKIEEEYAKRRESLYTTDESGTQSLKEGVTQGNVDELDRQAQEALDAVDAEFASREDTFQDWCDQIATMAVDELEEKLEEAQRALDEAKESGAGGSKLAAAQAKVTTAQNALAKAKKKQSSEGDSPDKRSVQDWNDLRDALNDCSDAFADIGDQVGGTAGKIISSVGQISSKTVSVINSVVQLTQTSSTAMQATSATGVASIKAVESASTILAIIGAVMQIAMTIASLFNKDDKIQEEIDELQGRIDDLQWELDNTTAAAIRDQIGSALDVVKDAYNQIVVAQAAALRGSGTVSASAAVAIARQNVEMQKSVTWSQTYNTALETVVKTYRSIGYASTKAFGDAKYDISSTLNNYAAQMLAYEQMIEDEKSKKKPDDDDIKEWEEAMDELAAEMQETFSDAIENIIGQSSDDIADTLGNAFFDAFESGENAAEAWGDSVKDIVAEIVKSMFINQYLSGKIADLFDKYADKWYDEDGVYQGFDAVANSLGDFSNDLNDLYDEFEDQWSALNDIFGDFVSDSSSREAASSGIATASQESVDELNGRATAIQGHTYTISENSKIIVSTINLILQSVIAIETNTGNLKSTADSIHADVTELRSMVDDMNTKGVRIRS